MTAAFWVVALLTPLLVAAGIVAGGAGRSGPPPRRFATGLVRWSQLSVIPAGLLAVLPGAAVPSGGGSASAGTDTVLLPLLLGTHLQLDLVARPLVLVGALLYGAALTAVNLEHTERSGQLAAFLLVCFTGNTGVFVAADTVTFYLAFALMSFSAYGLVLHTRTAESARAGRVYLVLTLISESAILLALLLVTAAGGLRTVDAPMAVAGSGYRDLIVGLLLVGFGVKAGLPPLHLWLPLAHPAAPPAASAVLSGAMVKAGLVGWLRFLPLGTAELDGWGLVLVLLALLGAFASVLVGAPQRDPKAVLAYSTISQMGFLGVVVAVALAAPSLVPACVNAAVIYAVHHGLAKGALFLGVPVWKHHAGRGRRLVLTGLVLAGLAVVGAPLSSGSVGKYAAKYAVDGIRVGPFDLVETLPLVATGSTLLLVRFVVLLHAGPNEHRAPARDPELWAWLFLVLTSASVPWLLTEAWVPVSAVPGLDPVTVWAASWPILLGLLLAVIGMALRRRWAWPVPALPPGDLVVPAEAAAGAAAGAVSRLGGLIGRIRDGALGGLRVGGAGFSRRVRTVAGRTEHALAQPAGMGLALLVLLLLAAVWVVGR